MQSTRRSSSIARRAVGAFYQNLLGQYLQGLTAQNSANWEPRGPHWQSQQGGPTSARVVSTWDVSGAPSDLLSAPPRTIPVVPGQRRWRSRVHLMSVSDDHPPKTP